MACVVEGVGAAMVGGEECGGGENEVWEPVEKDLGFVDVIISAASNPFSICSFQRPNTDSVLCGILSARGLWHAVSLYSKILGSSANFLTPPKHSPRQSPSSFPPSLKKCYMCQECRFCAIFTIDDQHHPSRPFPIHRSRTPSSSNLPVSL